MARKSTKLAAGPTAPTPAPAAGPPPPWWPDWMPWLDLGAFGKIVEQYNQFVTGGREPESINEMLGKSRDIIEDWAAQARKAIEGRMKER